MIEGIGMDLVEISRIEKVLFRQKRLPERILSQKERKAFENLKAGRKAEFLAGRFAAKEAYAKARGCGIGKDLSWQDIEIAVNEAGKPKLTVEGAETKRIHVSITHTKEYAAAQVVIESL